MANTRSRARAKDFRDAEYPLSASLAEHFDRLARESELELAAQGPAGKKEAALQLGRPRSARKQEAAARDRRWCFFWCAVELHAQFPRKSADAIADVLAEALESMIRDGEALPSWIGLHGKALSARTIRTYITGARDLSRRAGSSQK